MLIILVFIMLNCCVFCEGAYRKGCGSFHSLSIFDAEGDAEKMIPKDSPWPAGREIKSEHRIVPACSYINLLLSHFDSHSGSSWPLKPPRVLGSHVS